MNVKHIAQQHHIILLSSQQLQVLMDDSRRLQNEFPGGNAEQIAQQEAIVLENWGILQERAQQRKKDLLDAQDHYRFMASVSNMGQSKVRKVLRGEGESGELLRSM